MDIVVRAVGPFLFDIVHNESHVWGDPKEKLAWDSTSMFYILLLHTMKVGLG
jgi:hypothetical protein